jgi:hypothetical protein
MPAEPTIFSRRSIFFGAGWTQGILWKNHHHKLRRTSKSKSGSRRWMGEVAVLCVEVRADARGGASPLNAKKAELQKVIRLSLVGYMGAMGRNKGIGQMS